MGCSKLVFRPVGYYLPQQITSICYISSLVNIVYDMDVQIVDPKLHEPDSCKSDSCLSLDQDGVRTRQNVRYGHNFSKKI